MTIQSTQHGEMPAEGEKTPLNRRLFLGLAAAAVFDAAAIWQVATAEPQEVAEENLITNPSAYVGEPFVCTGTLKYIGKSTVPVWVGGFPMSSSQAASGVPSPITEVMEKVDVFRFGSGPGILAFRNIDGFRGAFGSPASTEEQRVKSSPQGVVCKVAGAVSFRGENNDQPFFIFSSIREVGVPGRHE